MKYKAVIALLFVFNLFGCSKPPCDEKTLANCSTEEVEQIKQKRIEEQVKKFKEHKAEDFQ
jgi:hypothetical protein